MALEVCPEAAKSEGKGQSHSRSKSELDLDSLREQVTCSLCHQLFKEPKLLPCFDLVCCDCLKQHASVVVSENEDGVGPSSRYTMECPKCQVELTVPDGRVEMYQTSLVTCDLVDVYTTLAENKVICGNCRDEQAVEYCEVCKVFQCKICTQIHERWPGYSSHKRVPIDQLTSRSILKDTQVTGKPEIARTCLIHVGEKVKMYCETCQELVCSDCTFVAHKDHTCEAVTEDLLQEHRSMMIVSLNTLAKTLQCLDEVTSSFVTSNEHLNRQTSEAKAQIETTFCEAQQGLNIRKQELLSEVDEHVRQPAAYLQSYNKHLELLRKQVLRSKDFLQQNLEHCSPTGLLSVERTVLKQIGELKKEVNDLKPVEEELLTLSFKRDKHTEEAIFSIGEVEFKLNPALMMEQSERTDSIHRKWSLELSLNLEVENSSSRPLLHSPQNTVVIETQKVSGIPVRVIEGIMRPSGITVTNNIVVCEFGTHQVSVLDQEGHVLRTIGSKGDRKGCFLYPQSVTMDREGKMLITDSNYRVQLFNKHGKFLRSVGKKGNKELSFRDPLGLAIGKKNQIFVCERENHRIQVLNRDLSFHSFIGKRGTGPGEFNHPTDVAVDKKGHLYVVDSYNHRIQVLTEDGTFVGAFGSKGSKPGELNCPSHICVDLDSYVYVTEIRNCRISSFRNDGTFMQAFGQKGHRLGELIEPRGIAVDHNRVLYVSDFGNNRIQVFK